MATRTYSTRKRVLVTGGAVFIGSHLCERLLAHGRGRWFDPITAHQLTAPAR